MSKRFSTIKALRACVINQSVASGSWCDCAEGKSQEHWVYGEVQPLANPMSRYRDYAASWHSWGFGAVGNLVIELEAKDGTVGVGVSHGGEPGCYIAENHLSRFVEGQDPRNTEVIWDQMYRATLQYGRKGLAMHVISGIDIALWDLLGKLRNEPVYALLGGSTKTHLPVYCTTSRPDIAKSQGFAGAKLACPYGPSAGDEGFKKNIEFFKKWRDAVGPEYPLMLDCYMAMTPSYVKRLVKALEPFGLKWIEDFLQPDDYAGYDDVRKSLGGSSVMLTTGEHEYTRYGFRRLLESRCVDIIQPDVMWMGGITEARRVVAIAAAYDVMVIPHMGSVYTYHLQFAFPNCPAAEFINLSPESDTIEPFFGNVFTDEPLPKNGFINLPEKPGFGVTLNRECLTRPYVREPRTLNTQQPAINETDPSYLPF